MATDLYILTQVPSGVAVGKRFIDHWLRHEQDHLDNEGSVSLTSVAHETVNIVIGDGDVLVKLDNGEVVQRSYASITTCHLCKLDLSFPSPDDPPVPPACALCERRTETYHRLAEIRVRHSLKMGYQHMYGPFKIAGSAPLPFPQVETANPEEISEILADCQADMTQGRTMLAVLRQHAVRGYQQTGEHQKKILVQKFGASVFRPGIEADTGVAEAEPNGNNVSVKTRLMRGEERLQELRIDIELYGRILAYEKRMGLGRT